MYYGGVSGRGVGKILGMNKSNVMNWIKMASQTEDKKVATTGIKIMKLDELYWVLECKPRTETRENVYIMTMVSRSPRQIVGHVVSRDKLSRTIQSRSRGRVLLYRWISRISGCSLPRKAYLHHPQS